ncbi:gliding motility-associated peptidyl-prolyl isomerase GldI [Tenacibaculum sp. IB213877]|uniref:gliding motility-associated peptidyl-prolyl isomerase GldI n=1 Tax=Tenacibaculum sp. IB213877 TaxID=3097351 RepID=UPI002A5AE9E6|nr:gliding motility-associated peptidyl-prolyl isomerase GldI [Tenacibaculum sp. IB213877]MDY0779856.1 gliding motility-associated peptidyl-prolyl isomerase GldI [Tenacibaculum sp. IB213877]
MIKQIFFVLLTVLFVSCKEQLVRRPKKHSTTNFYKEIIEENKKLNTLEKQRIEAYLVKDTVTVYKASSKGFWYTYVKKDTLNTVFPKAEDVVTIIYNIVDMQGNTIYQQQERTYKIDKEDFIPALQDGIKLMKQGETVTFVIPSYRAFGVTGDGNKIGINQTIKSTLTLKKINTNEIK